MTTIIKTSDCYALHFTAEPVEALPGQIEIHIQSQFTGAKDPAGLQTQFQAVVDRQVAEVLAGTILAGCEKFN